MTSYRIPSHVTHQTIDGEVIAINFDTGAYHSMRGSAAIVWNALVQAASIEEIAGCFAAPPGETAAALAAFVEKLVATNLLETVAETGAISGARLSSGSVPWSEPSIESFSDLERDLLMDPIHDVGDGAWPKR